MPYLIADAPCCTDGCPSPPQTQRVCTLCTRLFCFYHHGHDDHGCLFMNDEESDACYESASIGVNAAHKAALVATPLRAAALALRPAAEGCTVTIPDDMCAGSFNSHVDVKFDDGVHWLARTRKAGPDLGDRAWRRTIMLSDYETMRVLADIAPKYIPRAYLPCRWNDPVDYFFVERVEGDIPDEDEWKQTTIEDYVDLIIKLVSREFKGVGSFHARLEGSAALSEVQRASAQATSDNRVDNAPAQSPNDALGVEASIEERLVDGLVDDPQPGPITDVFSFYFSKPMGPFRTSQEAYLALIDDMLHQLETGHTVVPVSHRIHSYLVHLEMRALVLQCEEMAAEGPTYLRHGDDKPDCLLLHDDGHIAGVIDWEFAYTAPLPEAVSWEIFIDVDQHSKSNDLSATEQRLQDEFVRRGRQDIADALNGSRKYQRLRTVLGGTFTPRPSTKAHAMNNLRHAFLGDKAGPAPATYAEWWPMALERYGEDPGLKRLQQTIKRLRAEAVTHCKAMEAEETEPHLALTRTVKKGTASARARREIYDVEFMLNYSGAVQRVPQHKAGPTSPTEHAEAPTVEALPAAEAPPAQTTPTVEAATLGRAPGVETA